MAPAPAWRVKPADYTEVPGAWGAGVGRAKSFPNWRGEGKTFRETGEDGAEKPVRAAVPFRSGTEVRRNRELAISA